MKRVTPFVALNIFNLLCWLVIAFPIAIMYKHFTGNLRLLLAFSEAGLLMLPALFVGKRWRWSALIPVWLVAIFYLTNFWYWRFFHDMMPLSSYFLWSNVDEHVYKTWFALIKPGDLALVIPVLLVTTFYLYPLRKLIALAPSYSKRLRIRGALLILVYYVAMSHFYTTALRVKDLDFEPPFSAAYRTEFVKRWNVQKACIYMDYLELNLTSYLGRQVYINLIYRPLFSHRVNDEEVKMVHDFWEAHTAYANDKSVDIQDSITAYPPHKNLIFIIVESLNSFVVNQKIDGREVTPTLNALIREPGTVSALNVETQILTGVSSDGQFIYNTGMLPSSEVTTVYYYDKNQYASLAHTFKDKYSFEMICESVAVWNHANTTIAYGYDQLYSDIKFEKTHRGCDGNLFDHASMVIDTLRVPFFAELTTISMHGPFKDPDVSRPDWIDKAKMTESMRDYLTVTHYFDEELGKFLAHLKQRGIYEDTMIVIASDHNVLVEGMAEEEQNRRRIVFVAANTGVTAQIGKVVGQVDVFPTVLELMGVDAGTTWSGVGLSMFNPHCQGALDKEGRVVGASSDSAYVEHLKLARKASNVMLRMDYFKR